METTQVERAAHAVQMPMTLEEYMALGPDVKAEIIEGELIVMSPTGPQHGEICGRLVIFVGNYVLQHRLGVVYTEQTAYVEKGAQGLKGALAPDVSFVRREKLDPKRDPDRFFDFAPDLAVEVLSPSDTYRQIGGKVKVYLRRGAALVWVVDPFNQTVTVYTPSDPKGAVYAVGDTLGGGDVLPGLALPVEDIFMDILTEGGAA